MDLRYDIPFYFCEKDITQMFKRKWITLDYLNQHKMVNIQFKIIIMCDHLDLNGHKFGDELLWQTSFKSRNL